MSKEQAAKSYQKAIDNDQPSLLPKSDYINEYLIPVGTKKQKNTYYFQWITQRNKFLCFMLFPFFTLFIFSNLSQIGKCNPHQFLWIHFCIYFMNNIDNSLIME